MEQDSSDYKFALHMYLKDLDDEHREKVKIVLPSYVKYMSTIRSHYFSEGFICCLLTPSSTFEAMDDFDSDKLMNEN